MSSLTRFNNENLNECGKPVFKLVGDNGNDDNVFTHYERKPGNSLNVVSKSERLYIVGCLIRNPREITRQISQNCRVQKVSSTVTYQLQGSFMYSPEKIDEIERLFHSKHIYLNDVEIQFEGGQVFETIGEDFPNQFRLNVTISECLKWQIFGCDRPAESIVLNPDIKLTFGIPEKQSRDIYFDDSGIKIASNYTELLEYYGSRPEVISVTDIDMETVQTDVKFNRIFQIEYDRQTPDPFYYDKFSASNKVYGLQLSTPDAFNELSRGMNVGTCTDISIIGTEIISKACTDISLGSIMIIKHSCQVVDMGNWKPYNSENNILSNGLDTYLNLSLFNPDISQSTSTFQTGYSHVGDNETICNIPLNEHIPEGYEIISVTLNDVEISGAYTYLDGFLNVDPCINFVESDNLKVFCESTESEGFIGAIGQISGMCSPSDTIEFTSDDDSQIPVGTVLTLTNTGLIMWNGPVTNYTEIGGIISISNLKIN